MRVVIRSLEQKLMRKRSGNFSSIETKLLQSLIVRSYHRRSMVYTRCNQDRWLKISRAMEAAGYKRTSKVLKTKLYNMLKLDISFRGRYRSASGGYLDRSADVYREFWKKEFFVSKSFEDRF